MPKLIDNQGRIFGKINVIDFLLIVCFLCLIPFFILGQKIVSKENPPYQPPTTYVIGYPCPICGRSIEIKINKGELPSNDYDITCGNCGNKVILMKFPPIISKSEETDYMQEFFQWLNENREYLERFLEQGKP